MFSQRIAIFATKLAYYHGSSTTAPVQKIVVHFMSEIFLFSFIVQPHKLPW